MNRRLLVISFVIVAVAASSAAALLWLVDTDQRGAPALLSAPFDNSQPPDGLIGRPIDEPAEIDALATWLTDHSEADPVEIDRLATIDLDAQVVYAVVEKTCPTDDMPSLSIDEGRLTFSGLHEQACLDDSSASPAIVVSVFAVDAIHRAALDQPSYEAED